MTELMGTLFRYSEEHVIHSLLSQEREYAETSLYVEQGEEKLRALIDEEHREFVEALLDEEHLLSFFREMAQFRAGFQLAAELIR